MIVRHFEWDQDETEYDTRIFVVTEGISVRRRLLACCECGVGSIYVWRMTNTGWWTYNCLQFFVFVLIAVEIFYIFFVSNEMAEFLLVVVLASLEVLVIAAGFTTVRTIIECANAQVHNHLLKLVYPNLRMRLLLLFACMFVCCRVQLKNIATGLFLIFAEPFRTDSLCRIHDLLGFIEKVSLARTTLRQKDGSLVFIPNGVFADWHQTSGSAQEAQLHELVLQIHQRTPIEKIQQLIDELSVILPQFAMPDDPATRVVSFRGSESAEMTPQSTQCPNDANRSFASTDVRPTAALTMTSEERSVRVVLHAMYRVKVSILVDRARFASLEAVKTEVRTGGESGWLDCVRSQWD